MDEISLSDIFYSLCGEYHDKVSVHDIITKYWMENKCIVLLLKDVAYIHINMRKTTKEIFDIVIYPESGVSGLVLTPKLLNMQLYLLSVKGRKLIIDMG